MSAEKRDEIVGVRLEPTLRTRADAAARAEHRTLSAWVRLVILDKLAADALRQTEKP